MRRSSPALTAQAESARFSYADMELRTLAGIAENRRQIETQLYQISAAQQQFGQQQIFINQGSANAFLNSQAIATPPPNSQGAFVNAIDHIANTITITNPNWGNWTIPTGVSTARYVYLDETGPYGSFRMDPIKPVVKKVCRKLPSWW